MDAAVVVRAMDAAIAGKVDTEAAVVVVVAVSVLLVDSNAEVLPDGSRIAATIAVKGLGAVFERQLRFGSSNSAIVLFVRVFRQLGVCPRSSRVSYTGGTSSLS